MWSIIFFIFEKATTKCWKQAKKNKTKKNDLRPGEINRDEFKREKKIVSTFFLLQIFFVGKSYEKKIQRLIILIEIKSINQLIDRDPKILR